MLAPKTGKYATSALPPQKDNNGVYYPDSIVDPFVEEARQATPKIFANHLARPDEFGLLQSRGVNIPEPKIPLEKAKALIIKAYTDFDPALGKRAAEIFETAHPGMKEKDGVPGARWNLEEVPAGQCKMQQCRPANSADNSRDHAVIDYQYDGTIDGVIYMAHEVGHAIADDCTREKDHHHKDSPRHVDELQAYFGQHITYNSLMRSEDPKIAEAAQRHMTATMTQNLYHVPVALGALDRQNGGTGTAALETWLGPEWRQHGHTREASESLSDEFSKSAAPQARDSYIERLHSRPMGLFVAAGLVDKAEAADPETRRRIADTVLGRNGPKNAAEMLATAGVETEDDMRNLARSTIRDATKRLDPPATSAERKSRPGRSGTEPA